MKTREIPMPLDIKATAVALKDRYGSGFNWGALCTQWAWVMGTKNMLADMCSLIEAASLNLVENRQIEHYLVTQALDLQKSMPGLKRMDTEDIWQQIAKLRVAALSPKERGYRSLLESGELGVRPNFIFALQNLDSIEGYTQNVGTVAQRLTIGPNQRGVVAYDSEDMPVLLAIKSLICSGYQVSSPLREQVDAYVSKFEKGVGRKMDSIVAETAPFITVNGGQRELDAKELNRWIELHPHFFDATLSEDADEPTI